MGNGTTEKVEPMNTGFKSGFTIREAMGEDKYTEFMCKFYGMKYSKVKEKKVK